MRISRLTLTRFLSHDSTTVELPERGIVVVTGENGAGKSSFIEAVSVGAWGKPLRGTAPWREGQAGSVTVTTSDGLTIERVRSKGGKASLGWQRAGVEPVEYETPTKAQEALEASIGAHDVWRRTSVFSSSDAAHFTLASDAERKRLLESILQLDRFDAALEACRRDLSTVRQRVSAADKLVATLTARAEGARQALERAREEARASAPAAPLAQLGEELERIDASIAAYTSDLAANQVRRRQVETERTGLGLVVEDKARALARVERGACPTCGQATQAIADELRQELSDARAAHAAQAGELDALLSELREEAQELTEEAQVLRGKRVAVADRLSAAKALSATYSRAQRALAQAEQEATRWDDQLADARRALEADTAEQEELEACDRVLGMRGVRATLLGRALRGIEQAANVWLSRLGMRDLRLRLSATTERKSGTVADAISLDVEGAGGGYGYRAASGGERRRLDVALLLALSDVAGVVADAAPGTLWVDEAFDSLDSRGVAVVVEALTALSESRCVVVITHSEELAQAIPAVQRMRVSLGRLC